MEKGRLEHQQQSFSVDVEIDDRTEQKLTEASDGEVNDIEVTVKKGYTGNSDIYISKDYDNLEVGSMSHDVEILEEIPENRMVKPGTKIKVRVTTRVEKPSSAIFQK